MNATVVFYSPFNLFVGIFQFYSMASDVFSVGTYVIKNFFTHFAVYQMIPVVFLFGVQGCFFQIVIHCSAPTTGYNLDEK